MEADPLRWDKAWEKALRTVSPSEDVYPKLGCLWRRDLSDKGDDHFKYISDGMHYRASWSQGMVVRMVDGFKDNLRHLVTAWMLLDESEQRRHLLNGIMDACHSTIPFDSDARALCPEITTSAMMKRNGQAFIDFARNLAKGIQETDPDKKPYLLPSDWWRSAVQEPEPSETTKFVFIHLSVQRNEFIGESAEFPMTC
jgi:hypothetical protein